MPYINAIKKKDNILIWERNNGKREVVIQRAPYYFYSKSPQGTFTSMYGDTLVKHTFATQQEFNNARANYRAIDEEIFESDIQPELKLLSNNYYEKPAPKLNVTLYDIEVDYDEDVGFSSINNPYAPINSIALFHIWSNTMVLLAVPPKEYQGVVDEKSLLIELNKIAELPSDCEYEIVICENEKELLEHFLLQIEDADLLSGWNSQFFDDPYVAKRLELLGKPYLKKLSFNEGNMPRFKEITDLYGAPQTVVETSGRVCLDYLLIFKKYEVVDRPSFTLDAISNAIIINKHTKEPLLAKLEYNGSLAKLYRTDFLKFIRYNLRDTEILKKFEEILGYIELSNQMCHMSTGLFKHVTGTIKLSELATINYCHHEMDNLIVNDIHPPENAPKAKGAFVLLPQRGEHDWIGSIDINSLYPSAIRSINISPETIIGQFIDDIDAFYAIKDGINKQLTLKMQNGENITASTTEWQEACIAKKWAISGYGTVFSQHKKGIMPNILEYWYSTRKKYQKLMREAKAAGDHVNATYYNKLQYVYKIKLNSYYGALLNSYFRFYDVRLGESTTGTSRVILLHQCAKVAELLDGEYVPTDILEYDKYNKPHIGYSKKWSIIGGDTDSTYFKTHARNEIEAVEIADLVGELTSASFPKFMRETFGCTDGFDDIIKTGREIIADKGIFIKKKRYILHIVDDENEKVDKLKVMGVETKKTTSPPAISKKLNGYIEQYLKGKAWDDIVDDIVAFKEQLYNTNDIMTIGLPKGVRNVERYTSAYKADSTTTLPGHVAASIFYNICLKEFNDNTSPNIKSGMKIKVFYIMQTCGRFKSIAIPTDIDEVPNWFLANFKVDRDAHITRLIDKPLNNIINAIDKTTPSKQSVFTDALLEF